MTGGIEYSAEFVRVWNLLSRCRGCRRKVCALDIAEKMLKEMKKKGYHKDYIKVTLREYILKNCRIHPSEFKYLDVLRFQELKESFDPKPDEPDHFPDQAIAETDENGAWITLRIVSTD